MIIGGGKYVAVICFFFKQKTAYEMFFFHAGDDIRVSAYSHGLGDEYKGQVGVDVYKQYSKNYKKNS